VGRYVNVIGSQMKTKEELEEAINRTIYFIKKQVSFKCFFFLQIQSFINKSSGYLKGADLVINQTIETIKRNTEWTSKFYNKIVNYMVQ